MIKRQGAGARRGRAPFFERSLGHDFRGVRVHDDREAAESARAEVNARAYTVGHHVVSDGPLTPWVLGHELAHTVRRRGMNAARGPLALGPSSSVLERNADDVATRAMGGQPVAAT